MSTRPTAAEYAILSQAAYQGSALERGDMVEKLTGWEVHDISQHGDYCGVIVKNTTTKQIAVAHRGTDNLKTLLVDDIIEIYFGRPSTQHHAAFRLVEQAVKLAQKQNAELSFTGHSLGAFLAELSVLYCHRSFNRPEVRAVTFESPGSRASLEQLNATHGEGRVDLEQLDIISYLSYPNIVNTAHPHVGTLYSLHPDMGQRGWFFDVSWYTKRAHSIDGIVDLFATQPDLSAPLILDWPTGNQRSVYDKHAKWVDGHYQVPVPEDFTAQNAQQFALDYQAHFKVSATSTHQNTLALRHCSAELQVFLPHFYSLLTDIQRKAGRTEPLCKAWKEWGVPDAIAACLLGGYSVVRLGSGQLELRLAEALTLNVQTFTQTVHGWLKEKPRSILELLQVGGVTAQDDRIKVVAQLIAEGAEVSGTLRRNTVSAAKLTLPSDADDALIAKAKEMQLQLKQVYKEINVYLVAPGAKVHKDAILEDNDVSAGNLVFVNSSSTQAVQASPPLASTLGSQPVGK